MPTMNSHRAACVDGRQDEQRLEHDGEVVPVGHQAAHAGQAAENLGHPDREGHGAARAAGHALADRGFDGRQVDHLLSERRVDGRRRVDREVVARIHGRGGDERHDADQALRIKHRTVADRPDVALLVDHLGRRARRNERVKP
jgi:hypothetical protein